MIQVPRPVTQQVSGYQAAGWGAAAEFHEQAVKARLHKSRQSGETWEVLARDLWSCSLRAYLHFVLAQQDELVWDTFLQACSLVQLQQHVGSTYFSDGSMERDRAVRGYSNHWVNPTMASDRHLAVIWKGYSACPCQPRLCIRCVQPEYCKEPGPIETHPGLAQICYSCGLHAHKVRYCLDFCNSIQHWTEDMVRLNSYKHKACDGPWSLHMNAG